MTLSMPRVTLQVGTQTEQGMDVNVCVYQGGLPGGEGSIGFQVKVVVFFQSCLSHIRDDSFFSLDGLDWAR